MTAIETFAVNKETTKALHAALVAHGYLFHQRILEKLRQAFMNNERWEIVASEFVVSSAGRDTRIDIVLKQRYDIRSQICDVPLFLAIECKRVNPRFARWLFVRPSQDAARGRRRPHFTVDSIRFGDSITNEVAIWPFASDEYVADVGIVAKTRETSDGSSARDAIEGACTQACIGANGLLNYWLQGELRPEEPIAHVVPVVLTTAELYCVDLDPRRGSATGDLEPDGLSPIRVPLVHLQYPVSRSLRPAGYGDYFLRTNLRRMQQTEFIRTVPIVSAEGITEFLGRMHRSDNPVVHHEGFGFQP